MKSREETAAEQSAVHNVALSTTSPSQRWASDYNEQIIIILFWGVLFIYYLPRNGISAVLNLFFFCTHVYEGILWYVIPAGPLVYFLQHVDGSLSRASPFAAVGVVAGTIYWSAVTYGAVTVMQVSELSQ